MIYLHSTPADITTLEVIRWLNYYGYEHTLVSRAPDLYRTFALGVDDFRFEVNQKTINLKNLTSFWYRRSSRRAQVQLNAKQFLNIDEIKNNILLEYQHIENYVSHRIQSTLKNACINSLSRGTLNKLEVLEMANKVGLSIPQFIVTNTKDYLLRFKKKHGKIILKPISNVVGLQTNKGTLTQYTKLISNKEIEKIPLQFFPTLFQQYIDKDFEIRTFFLNRKFYSMAIFSQSNSLTKNDFRRYDTTNPNRTIPFNLPKIIEDKLTKVFKTLTLNSGSVDILHTNDDRYYFLEINPVGQFGMVSHACNYQLEEKVAKLLAK